jgi:hypothetical protein
VKAYLYLRKESLSVRRPIDFIALESPGNRFKGEIHWAKKTKQAMGDANGRHALFERIPHEVVEEALADIKALATAWV